MLRIAPGCGVVLLLYLLPLQLAELSHDSQLLVYVSARGGHGIFYNGPTDEVRWAVQLRALLWLSRACPAVAEQGMARGGGGPERANSSLTGQMLRSWPWGSATVTMRFVDTATPTALHFVGKGLRGSR